MKRRGSTAARSGYRGTLISDNSRSAASEAYRVLRTNLMHSSDEINSVLFTSPLSGEGKSITCANLATVMSNNGQDVVILDADLRLPSQHLIFNVAEGGYPQRLLACADSEQSLDALIDDVAVPIAENLTLIPAGAAMAQAAELLGSTAFSGFLDALADRFDMVLIDSPPVGLVTDAAILANQVDGVVLVLDFQRAQRRATLRAVNALDKVNATILGAVLNKAPSASAESSYGYGSGSSHRGA